MTKIRVPATSANMGPGFDSLGIALNLYNYITVEETDCGLDIEIIGNTKEYLPTNEKNLIYRCMNEVFLKSGYKPKGLKLTFENNIPVTRGLGSSSAGIVGGLYVGNMIAGNPMSKKELLHMATEIEGHADNVLPAIFGGFTINASWKHKINYARYEMPNDLKFVAIIPDFPLSTRKARAVLPKYIPFRDAVFNSGHSALLAASLISGKYENIRPAIADRLHQNYRKRLIPNMEEIFRLCYQCGALGVYLSGAGPTIMAMVKASNKSFNAKMSHILANKMKNWQLYMLEIDNEGVKEI